MKHLACLLWILGLVATGRAQTNIDWFTLDAGGGVHISSNYILNFTAGQSEVGSVALTSANYRILPGFWALDNVGPATGRPTLSITLNGPNVILSWPSPSAGFVLEQSDSLDVLPAAWSDTLALVNDNGVLRSVVVPHNGAKRFFRLRKN